VKLYTVIIFLAQNGRIHAVKFRPNNFGRISFDLGEISPNQQILWLNNVRNSPKSEKKSPEIFEGEPQLRGFARLARKNIYCVARALQKRLFSGLRLYYTLFHGLF
jgi:hypothetical protein